MICQQKPSGNTPPGRLHHSLFLGDEKISDKANHENNETVNVGYMRAIHGVSMTYNATGTQDWYDGGYSNLPVIDPLGSLTEGLGVCRGGSFAGSSRSAEREECPQSKGFQRWLRLALRFVQLRTS